MIPHHLQAYIQYIKNTAQVPLKIEHFDDDWNPIGTRVRADLVKYKAITEVDGGILLVEGV